MALPTNRTEFKEYILRRLGFPVIEINVDEEQIDDRIEDALQFFQDYHYDGSEKIFMKHQITADDKVNKYIPIADEVTTVVRVFPASSSLGATQGMFSLEYQMALNDMFNISSASLVPYVSAMQHWSLFSSIFSTESGIQFNRNIDKLYINHNWDSLTVGNYLLIECYRILDPAKYSEVWSDRWLLRYATALVKRQYGEHLSKYSGVQMLGGVSFNGTEILSQANAEIDKLESEMINSYSLPVMDQIG